MRLPDLLFCGLTLYEIIKSESTAGFLFWWLYLPFPTLHKINIFGQFILLGFRYLTHPVSKGRNPLFAFYRKIAQLRLLLVMRRSNFNRKKHSSIVTEMAQLDVFSQQLLIPFPLEASVVKKSVPCFLYDILKDCKAWDRPVLPC